MTLLKKVCADMVESQDKLELLYRLQRELEAGRRKPRVFERICLNSAVVSNRNFIVRARMTLMSHPAANDAVNLPGAA